MKKFLFPLLFSLYIHSVFAQLPQFVPYQAVARNSAGNLLVNQSVGLRFTIRETSSTGVIDYQETQTTTTNNLGLFAVNIGSGTVVTGTLSAVPWSNGVAKYTQVEIDPTGGTSYTNMGAAQMMSVPYALYAGSASSVPLTAGQGIAVSGDQVSETLPIISLTTTGSSGAAAITSGALNIPQYQAALTFSPPLANASNTVSCATCVTTATLTGLANPTGSIGMTAINGSATTAMRSDGTPAINAAITPTWTGTHTFSNGTYSAAFTGGPVGIGTSSPAAELHVVTGDQSSGTLSAWGANELVVGKTGTTGGGVGISYDNSNSVGTIYALAPGVAWKDLALRANNITFNYGGGSEGMRLSSAGKVGIGTASPGSLLTVNGTEALWNTNQVQFYTDAGATERGYVGNATSVTDMSLVSTVSGDWLRIGANASSICFFPDGTVSGSGSFPMVKINPQATTAGSTGTNPGSTEYAVLEVWGCSPGSPISSSTTSTNQSNTTYGWDASSGQGRASVSNRSYSLYTWSSIWCNGEVDATSDERIKHVLDTSNNARDLAAVKKLNVVDYQYIDKGSMGDAKVKGFLAQQVEDIFPDAVRKQPGIIPCVYADAEQVKYDAGTKKLTITMSANHGLVKGDNLQLHTDEGDEKATVCEVINEKTFVVDNWKKDSHHVFVFGKEVPDLRNLDYNKIFSAGISAIQELSKQVDALKAENAGLKSENSDLIQNVKSTDLKYNQLKTQVDNLQTLMEKNGIRGEK